jgi:hypothetical protein
MYETYNAFEARVMQLFPGPTPYYLPTGMITNFVWDQWVKPTLIHWGETVYNAWVDFWGRVRTALTANTNNVVITDQDDHRALIRASVIEAAEEMAIEDVDAFIEGFES